MIFESRYIVEKELWHLSELVYPIIVLIVINELCSVGGVAALYFLLIFAQKLAVQKVFMSRAQRAVIVAL